MFVICSVLCTKIDVKKLETTLTSREYTAYAFTASDKKFVFTLRIVPTVQATRYQTQLQRCWMSFEVGCTPGARRRATRGYHYATPRAARATLHVEATRRAARGQMARVRHRTAAAASRRAPLYLDAGTLPSNWTHANCDINWPRSLKVTIILCCYKEELLSLNSDNYSQRQSFFSMYLHIKKNLEYHRRFPSDESEIRPNAIHVTWAIFSWWYRDLGCC